MIPAGIKPPSGQERKDNAINKYFEKGAEIPISQTPVDPEGVHIK